RCGRSELVYRVQCVDWLVGALLWPLRHVGDAPPLGARRARLAERTEPMWLQDFQPVSLLRSVSWFTRLSDDRWYRALPRHERLGYARARTRQFLLRPGHQHHRARTWQWSFIPVRLHGRQSFPVGLHLSPGNHAELARARQRSEYRRIHKAADVERAGLFRAACPTQA